MYTIAKQFSFDAAHRLHGLPPEHKCSHLHGHTYTVEVVLRSLILNDVGFVVDYNDLAAFKRYLDEEFDHRYLNEVFPLNPTAENLARHFYDWCKAKWPETCKVRVSETPKTWAEYSDE